ncbi:MAG: AbgT family transporter [Phycisphaerales bacterium]
MLQNIVPNFAGFCPTRTVLVALLGRRRRRTLRPCSPPSSGGLILAAPPQLVTLVVGHLAVGVVSNTASEMGQVVIIPLAMPSSCLGRHPLAGMAAASLAYPAATRQHPHRHRRPPSSPAHP